MARINIEDCWWSDPRRVRLALKAGSETRADGAMLAAWKLAQLYWKQNRRPIPKPKFLLLELASEILEVGLALCVEGDDFVYICGSSKHHDWLITKQEDGKKGGQKTQESIQRNHSGKFQAKPSKAKVSQSSSSSSLSLSLSSSDSNSFNIQKNSKNDASASENVRTFIAAYCELWKLRYKTNPEMGGKPAGIATRLVKNLGIKRAHELVGAYLEMNDIWFIQRRHDLVTMESNLPAIVIYADTGSTVTQGELRQADRAQANKNVWDSFKGKPGGSDGKS